MKFIPPSNFCSVTAQTVCAKSLIWNLLYIKYHTRLLTTSNILDLMNENFQVHSTSAM